MVRNSKVTGTALPMALGITIGVGSSILMLVLSVVFIARLIIGEKMPLSAIGYVIMAAHVLSVCMGGIIASAAFKHRKMVVCLIVSAMYYLVLVSCTAIFFGGQYQGMGITALVVAGAAGITGWFASREKNNGTKRYKKYRNR